METSFANAGEVSPGYSAPWAGPGVPIKAIHWMLMQHSPLVIWPLLDPAMWRWGAMMLANCTSRAYALNKSRMVPIAEYSRDCLKALRARHRHRLRRARAGHAAAVSHAQATRRHGQGHRRAAPVRRALRSARPRRLRRASNPACATRSTNSSVHCACPATKPATAISFTQRLAAMAAARGARLRFDTAILGLERMGDRITGVRTTAGTLTPTRW